MKNRALIVIMILGFSIDAQSAVSARADCRSECENQYESNIQMCSSLLNRGAKPDALEVCMINAERVYDTCLDECEDRNEAALTNDPKGSGSELTPAKR